MGGGAKKRLRFRSKSRPARSLPLVAGPLPGREIRLRSSVGPPSTPFFSGIGPYYRIRPTRDSASTPWPRRYIILGFDPVESRATGSLITSHMCSVSRGLPACRGHRQDAMPCQGGPLPLSCRSLGPHQEPLVSVIVLEPMVRLPSPGQP